jgi:hypothetical protein
VTRLIDDRDNSVLLGLQLCFDVVDSGDQAFVAEVASCLLEQGGSSSSASPGGGDDDDDDNATDVVIDGSTATGGDEREVVVDSNGNAAVPPQHRRRARGGGGDQEGGGGGGGGGDHRPMRRDVGALRKCTARPNRQIHVRAVPLLPLQEFERQSDDHVQSQEGAGGVHHEPQFGVAQLRGDHPRVPEHRDDERQFLEGQFGLDEEGEQLVSSFAMSE